MRSFQSCSVSSKANIFRGQHVKSHVILTDHSNLVAEVFHAVFAKVDTSSRIWPARGSYSRASSLNSVVLPAPFPANQGNSFARIEAQADPLQDAPVGSLVGKREGLELKASSDAESGGSASALVASESLVLKCSNKSLTNNDCSETSDTSESSDSIRLLERENAPTISFRSPTLRTPANARTGM